MSRTFRHLLAALLLATSLSVPAATFTGPVIGISDGGTITVLDADLQQRKIRLAGIDAPENKQPFGMVSRQRLADRIFGREVIADCPRRDKYRRELCTIFLNGEDQNLAQIQAGMAWWYRHYAHEQEPAQARRYERAEREALAAAQGLWRDPDPVPPWEWRHTRKGTRVGADTP